MKKETQQYYIDSIKSYIFKRILISCMGLSSIFCYLLTLTVLRGSTLETGVVIALGYGLISALAITAITIYRVNFTPTKSQILALRLKIKRRQLYLQRKSRSLKKNIQREDYGFQTAPLQDLMN